MRRRLALASLTAATLLATAACGNDSAGTTGSPNRAATPASSSSAAQPPASSPAVAAAVTPDAVCALVSLAQMGQATGYTFTANKTETSGDVAVCHYVGAGGDGYSSSKVILEYQPTGKSTIEYTKSKGVAVDGLGGPAYYFASAGQLSVELAGTASFTVYVEDTRVHGGDPKAAATEIARIAVPQLLNG